MMMLMASRGNHVRAWKMGLEQLLRKVAILLSVHIVMCCLKSLDLTPAHPDTYVLIAHVSLASDQLAPTDWSNSRMTQRS
jgi:hypothetical protein